MFGTFDVIAIFSPIVGLAAGLILAVAVFPIARLVSSARYRWGTASVDRVGYEAWVREYARERRCQERQVGQRRRALRRFQVQVRTQRLEFGDVDFLDIGKMRNGARSIRHALGDDAAYADHLDFIDAAARAQH